MHTMQLNRKVVITPLAMVGLYVLLEGTKLISKFGFTTLSLGTLLAGAGLCLCVLILTFREQGDTINFFRIFITIGLGSGIMIITLQGLLHTPAKQATVYYGLGLASLLILCIAFWLAYQEYGHYDIKLRD
jgi:hypothetical protein